MTGSNFLEEKNITNKHFFTIWQVVAPFEGLLRQTTPTQVTIDLKRARNMMVILENVQLDENLDGEEVNNLTYRSYILFSLLHYLTAINSKHEAYFYFIPCRHIIEEGLDCLISHRSHYSNTSLVNLDCTKLGLFPLKTLTCIFRT